MPHFERPPRPTDEMVARVLRLAVEAGKDGIERPFPGMARQAAAALSRRGLVFYDRRRHDWHGRRGGAVYDIRVVATEKGREIHAAALAEGAP